MTASSRWIGNTYWNRSRIIQVIEGGMGNDVHSVRGYLPMYASKPNVYILELDNTAVPGK